MNHASLHLSPPDSPIRSSLSGVNWPTVMVSTGAAAVIAAIILTIGVLGLSRGHNGNDQTIVVQAQETTPLAPGGTPAKTPSTATTAPGSASLAADRALGAPTGIGEPQPESRTGAGHNDDAGRVNSTDTANTESTNQTRRWVPTTALPADFAVTTQNPSLEDLNNIVYFLTATDAPDAAKARNIESQDAIIVPQTVSRIGLFRAPRGGSRVTGPIEHGSNGGNSGNSITVQLTAFSAGIPDVSMPINFVYLNGTWRLANSSLCNGVRTVGLPIYCNA